MSFVKATPQAASVDTEVIVGIVEQLPFGIAIYDRELARPVYANRASALIGRDGQASASADIRRHRLRAGEREYDVVTALDATQQRANEERLTRLAFFDELTGLPKSHVIRKAVNQLIAQNAPSFALSFIDVDNFKFINDYYGHDIGDKLLQKIAQRISENFRSTDMLARVGGDEFVLLTSPVNSLAGVSPELERLTARFREPFYIDGFEIFSSASIGASLFPLHGQSYDALRANADSAMYRVKESTKGGVQIFDETLSAAATARMELEQRLRLAIRDRKIHCAFQPKIDFRADAITGLEVLLRWRDDRGVLQAPGDFIKLAIELGLMDDIALIILDQVVEQIDLINDAFGAAATISLNVAAKQATDIAFMQTFVRAIAQTGFASRFIVELTEEAFLSKDVFRTQVLPMLCSQGIRISIDDFGVGYSSLSALAEISADELKIDRSFITDIHLKGRNQTIVKMIELLGADLGMKIVVEGVETEDELNYLIEHTGISCAQGYFFSRPVVLREQDRIEARASARSSSSRSTSVSRAALKNR